MNPDTFFDKFDQLTDVPDAVAKVRELILWSAFSGGFVSEVRNQRLPDELLIEGAPELPAIPSSWAWASGREVYKVIRGVTYAKNDASDVPSKTSCPLLRANNINGALNFDDLVYIPRTIIKEEQFILRGDIVIAMSSGSKKLVGKAAQVLEDFDGAFGAFCGVIRNTSETSDDFLARYFKSPQYTSWVTSAGRGIGINNLARSDLDSLPIPLPPLAEQKRIVAKVDELMALCDKLEIQLQARETKHAALARAALARFAEEPTPANLELLFHQSFAVEPAELRKAILSLAVRGKLVPQDKWDEPAEKLVLRIKNQRDRMLGTKGFRKTKHHRQFSSDETPYDIPDSWAWTMLEEITEIGTGSTPSRTESTFWIKGSVPWVNSGATSNSLIMKASEFVTEKAVKAHRLRNYPTGTLLIALYGQGKTRGQVAVLGIAATINQACAAVCSLDGFPSMQGYLRLLLEKQYDEVRSFSAGGAQPNLNVQKIKEIFVPLPPLTEQDRIVAKVDQLMGLVDRYESQLDESRELGEKLLGAMVAEFTTEALNANPTCYLESRREAHSSRYRSAF
jgi:type I restriction enzyme, S subunit